MRNLFVKLVAKCLLLGAVTLPVTLASTGVSNADSCWNHNGSLMRLKASGNQRWFYYEKPREVLRKAGVRRGTLLFNGRKNGNWYSGTARRFSKFCPGSPLEYYVEGPVRGDQLQVTVSGTRDVYKQCQYTGNVASDTLVFTYVRDC